MRERKKILVIGHLGQVGYELCRTLAPLGQVVGVDREEWDMTRPEVFGERLKTIQPSAVVNAAAYTAVDKAEQERNLAMAVNGNGPRKLAEECAKMSIPFVHYSTDYVFDGTAKAPYSEDHETAPLNAYGETKLAGDTGVLAAGGAGFVLRTSWVYGTRGTNFLRRMLQLAREREELRIVDDQLGCPTWSRLIAESTAQILARLFAEDRDFALQNAGIYNLVSSGQVTWHGFAKALLARDPHKEQQVCRRIVPITSADFPTPAKRPAYSVLSCEKLAHVFGIETPPWDEQLDLVMQDLP